MLQKQHFYVFKLTFAISFMISLTSFLGMVMLLKLFEDKENHDVFALVGYEDGSVALWDAGKCEMRKRLKICKDAGIMVLMLFS